jgi:hypothetical protein
MKTIFFVLLTLSLTAFAKEVKDFNKELIQNVQKDIRNDNIHSFEKGSLRRGPASVVEEDGQPVDKIEEVQKFDKMNVRQIGPNKW